MSPVITKSLAAQVRDVLRERIVRGAILPSSRIELDALATEFGTSITPVRDALRLLERDRLVVIKPRRGVFAAPIDTKAFKDVFDVRIALECIAVETAVQRIPTEALDQLAATYAAAAERLAQGQDDETVLGPIDSQVHDLIVRHCDNAVVRELMDSLRDRTSWVRRIAGQRAHRYRVSFDEHQAILAALRRRDSASTAARLREHLTGSRDHTLAQLAVDRSGSSATPSLLPAQ